MRRAELKKQFRLLTKSFKDFAAVKGVQDD